MWAVPAAIVVAMSRQRTLPIVALVAAVTVTLLLTHHPAGSSTPEAAPPLIPATLAPYSPPPVFHTTPSLGRPPAPGRGCGVERRDVKTGTDDAARSVVSTPHAATVADLAGFAAPVAPTTRVRPAETTVFAVRAILTDYKTEADSDVHLVLLDPGGSGTMVAEIPAPGCVGATSVFADAIARSRAAFEARYRPTDRYQRTSVAVTVTGVGFFDRVHGQRGVAANGIELHPVLSITFD
jgi:hypothetical protein